MDNAKSSKTSTSQGITRRSFLKGVGVSSVGIAVAGVAESAYADDKKSIEIIGKEGVDINLDVNGKCYKVRVQPNDTLAEVLREKIQLTGTKISCDRGACGACTVVMDGKTVTSCMTLALDARNSSIETIEGLGGETELQKSFIAHDALQCGFCTSGMIMSCKNLLDNNPSPEVDDVRKAVSGNLCRCGTYPKVFEAVTALKKQ